MSKTTVILLALLLPAATSLSQEPAGTDSTARKNILTIDGQVMSRGEYRHGGLPENEKDENYAAFIMERTRLSIDYERENL